MLIVVSLVLLTLFYGPVEANTTENVEVKGLRGIMFDRLECIANKAECVDLLCNLTHLEGLEVNLSIGCTLTKVHHKLMLRLLHFKKVGRNKFIQSGFDLTANICDLASTTNNAFINTFFPTILERIKTIIDTCPLTGPMAAKDFTLDGGTFPVFRNGEVFKDELTITNSRYLPVLTIKFYGKYVLN